MKYLPIILLALTSCGQSTVTAPEECEVVQSKQDTQVVCEEVGDE